MTWDASEIVVHNWPELRQLEDGRWLRQWKIALKNPPRRVESLRCLEEELSSEVNEIRFCVEGRELAVEVLSREWGWEPGQYTLSYKIFESVDRELGEIETIQGQKRNLWNPWLRKRQDSVAVDG